MNNILISIKKIFTNKNVVTVIGIIIILVLLYVGYNNTIKTQTQPIKVPVAAQTIQPRTLITDDMITTISVPKAAISTNVIRSASSVIGMYSNVNSVIPEGSMFYSNVLITKDKLPDSAFTEVADGERPYALTVTTASTYGNSIFPGNMIDIYMKAIDENGLIMVGRLLARVKVLAVKDSSGNNVFEDTSVSRTPSNLLFGVSDDIYVLLKKAEYLKSFGVELFPVPYGGTATITGDLYVDTIDLQNFIESNTKALSSSTIDGTTDNNATGNNTTGTANNNTTETGE